MIINPLSVWTAPRSDHLPAAPLATLHGVWMHATRYSRAVVTPPLAIQMATGKIGGRETQQVPPIVNIGRVDTVIQTPIFGFFLFFCYTFRNGIPPRYNSCVCVGVWGGGDAAERHLAAAACQPAS